MKLTPQRFFYLMIGLIVVGIAAIGYGYWWADGQLKASTATLSQQLADRDQADVAIGQLITLQRQYNTEVAPILPSLNAILPHTKDQTQVLLQLQTIANQVGLSITNVTLPSSTGLPSATSQTIAASGALALPITFDLKGSYSQLQAFLSEVEDLNRFTNVTSLSINRGASQITYSMTINAYEKP